MYQRRRPPAVERKIRPHGPATVRATKPRLPLLMRPRRLSVDVPAREKHQPLQGRPPAPMTLVRRPSMEQRQTPLRKMRDPWRMQAQKQACGSQPQKKTWRPPVPSLMGTGGCRR